MTAKLPPLLPCWDADVFCGPYPYRELPAQTPEALLELIDHAGFAGIAATPFPAVFHTQPGVCMERWVSAFRDDPRVRFWFVIDPTLPDWEADYRAAIDCDSAAGIRIFPRYHFCALFNSELLRLLEMADKDKMPVNLTARILDDRLHPTKWNSGAPLDLAETGAILKRYPTIRWILNGFHMPELKELRSAIMHCNLAFADVGRCKPFEPWWADLASHFPAERIVLGSGAPLHYHAGARLSLQASDISEDALRRILIINMEELLELRESKVAAAEGGEK